MATKPRNGWPVLDPLAEDPAMRKGSTNADLLDFNRRLYSPGNFAAQPITPTPAWRPAPGDYAYSNTTPSATAAGFPVAPSPMGPPTPNPEEVPYMTGSAGAAGGTSSYDQMGAPQPVSPQVPAPAGPGTPGQNALQAHQAEAATPPGMRPLSPQRQYFMALHRVDAHATQAPQNAPTDFDATFGGDAAHMGGPSVTWQQRQQQNQQKIAGAAAQRGLDFSPY